MTEGVVVRWSRAVTTAADVVAQPAQCFRELRNRPTWIFAFATAAMLAIIGLVLQISARVAAMTATGSPSAVVWQIVPYDYAASAIGTVIAILASAAAVALACCFWAVITGSEDVDFFKFWCGAVHVAIVSVGLSVLLQGAIVFFKGPLAFSDASTYLAAGFSLASVVPAESTVLHALAVPISPYLVWAACLYATMFRVFTNAPIAKCASAGMISGCVVVVVTTLPTLIAFAVLSPH